MPDDAPALEARLIERAQAGDADAYGELVALHQVAAFRVAWLLLRSAPEAEDVTQEAFVKAYLALERFRAGEPWRPWLLRIVANEARNRRRAAGRRAGLAVRAIAAIRGGSGGAGAESAEAQVLAGETRDEVRAALDLLREDERTIITFRYLLELSEAETAAALGIPTGTVKSRLHRGLNRLRSELAAPGGSTERAR